MILSSETDIKDVEQMIHFYKQYFAVVELVTCLKCGAYLAFECSGGTMDGMQPNELGKYVITIGDNLDSYRVRLDEAPTGERMMGYQCGAPQPNPAAEEAEKVWQEKLAKYEKQHELDLERFRKKVKKLEAEAKKKGEEPPTIEEPIYGPPRRDPQPPATIPCGNDTRIADVERGKVPVGKMQSTLSPFEKHRISAEIKKDPKHKAAFTKHGNIKIFETFQVERIA